MKKIILVLLILIPNLIFAENINNSEDIKNMFNIAKAYKTKKKYDKAEITYLEILGLSQNNVNALLGLADIYRNKNDFEKSEEYYNKVLLISEDNQEAKKAINELKKEKVLYENSADIHYTKGKKLFENSAIDESVNEFKKSIEINNNFLPSYIELGNVYLFQENLDLAQEIYKKAQELDKEFLPAYLGISKVYYKRKEYIKAQEILKQALKIDEEESIKIELELVNRQVDNIKHVIEIGDILRDNGFLNEAEEKYLSAQNEFPGYKQIYIKIGNIYLAQNNLLKAKEYYEKALKIDNLYVPGLVGIGLFYEKNKNPEIAQKYFIQVLKTDPQNKFAYNFFKQKEKNILIDKIADIIASPSITRAEFAALLVEKFELTRKIEKTKKGIIILDVDDHWAKQAIKKVVERDVMDMYQNYMFLPTKPITRCELAVHLKKILIKLSYDKKIDIDFYKKIKYSPYKDIDLLHENFDAIIICSLEGFMSGVGAQDNAFGADDFVTGEEAVELLDYLNKKLGI